MAHPDAVTQLARLLGRDEVHRLLGADPHPSTLSPAQRDALRGLIDRRLDDLVRGLAAEAVANDDVTSADAAGAYLEDRLAWFGDLLTPEQQDRVRAAARTYWRRWP